MTIKFKFEKEVSMAACLRHYSRSVTMAEFNRPYTTSYQSAIVSRPIALSCTIFELLDVEEFRNLDGSPKVIVNYTIRLMEYKLLSVFHCNSYGHTLYRLRDKARYRLKIAILTATLVHNNPTGKRLQTFLRCFLHNQAGRLGYNRVQNIVEQFKTKL